MHVLWENRSGLPGLALASFVNQLCVALPRLLDLLRSPELRAHPRWGKQFPFEVAAYGSGQSLGHCIRPDIILTPAGPRICELDFVPSGRGFTLSALSGERRQRYLETFAHWYWEMDAGEVAYATGSTTTVWDETVYFTNALRADSGLQISAVNIDETPTNGALVDRMFYRSELRHPELLAGKRVITAEPHLDSKMVFALIHDQESTPLLLQYLGRETLALLRTAFPATYVLEEMRHDNSGLLQSVLARPASGEVAPRGDWALKNADVETDSCWGCRGVILGRKYGAEIFRQAVVEGVSPTRKELGSRPVLQRFEPSVDFAPIWDAIVAGQVGDTDRMGKGESPIVRAPARKQVYARVGIYFLVSNVTKTVHVPPCGVLTLRQDELAHGATDALYTAFEII